MLPTTRAVLTRVVNLELELLPRLKGNAEKRIRALIWAAHAAIQGEAARDQEIGMGLSSVREVLALLESNRSPVVMLCLQCGTRYTPPGICCCPLRKSGKRVRR